MREFRDINAFVRHLQTLPPKMVIAGTVALRDAAEMVAKEAKGMLGHYQPAAGPFPAWAELADSTKEQRRELGFSENDPLSRTHELFDAIEFTAAISHAEVGVESRMVGDGTPANPVRDIGEVAADMEMGTSRIPPRPFLGPAAVHCEKRIVNMLGGAVAMALAGEQPTHAATERAAVGGLSDIPF